MALTTYERVGAMLRHQQGETVDHKASIEQYIDAVSSYLQRPNRYGQIEAATGTFTTSGSPAIGLPLYPNRPFAITGVTVDGVVFTDYVHDPATGLLYGGFYRGHANVVVSYTVGFAEGQIPADVEQAATMMCVHNWNVWSQRGTGYNDGLYPTGFFEPAAVQELMAAYKSPIGFA